jgi:[protein-PII] uridylyltransferase
MAARSFLLDTEVNEGRALLLKGATFPSGIVAQRREFSLWLEQRLIEKLNAFGDFQALNPVLLGSWSRHELCPKSDIDLLFLGPEDKVKAFVGAAFAQGLKLRARTPEDLNDWSVGVEPFDVLALQSARAMDPQTEGRILEQRRLVRSFRRKILSSIRRERDERRRRQDSVSNFLEPNIKFGAGGLRDIEQTLALQELFPEVFSSQDPYPTTVLKEIKEELLFLRALSHLQGSGDILTAHDQLEFAKQFGFSSSGELMKTVQSEFERASFYADWALAFGGASKKARATKPPADLRAAVRMLKSDPSLLNQFEIRRRIEDLNRGVPVKDTGKILHKALNGKCDDELLVGLHRTRMLEMWIPDFKKLRGLVQHDHYHRYTADAHLVQTLREVERARSHPMFLGKLKKIAKYLSPQDWWTLKLTALFHDLAKGRKGDHSTEGAALVTQYFKKWDYPEALTEDVRWLVENHLILSTAAFRQNPRSQTTWKRLFERGVQGRRLDLLALFTAIDIRATNADAWTDWKGQLLWDLVQSMHSPQALKLQSHLNFARKSKIKEAEDWMMNIDPVVLDSFSPKILLEDLREAARASSDLEPKVFTSKKAKGRVWLRLHRKKDETGVFLALVKRLFGFGLNIQTASVHTLNGVGVYNWFCVRTEKPAKQLQQWLSRASDTKVEVPQVKFQSVDLMAQDQDEWIFSFRGKDQRGLLVAAADALFAERLSLKWARAHTWGQQAEDVFSVRPLGEVEVVLERLRAHFDCPDEGS